MPRVMVVGGEAGDRSQLRSILESHRFETNDVISLEAAAVELRRAPPDLVIVDPRDLGGPTARDEMISLRRIDERVPVIVVIDEHTRGTMREAGDQFVARPIEEGTLLVTVHGLLELQRTRRRTVAMHVLEDRHNVDPFVGTSATIQQFSAHAHQVLDSHAPVLIQGETGTGKGVLARWLHQHGPRAEEAFVDINCAGLSREFVESELFGHERGAFTGATAAKLGLLDVAHRGTAFLDEIGEIDLLLQPRLLKVLEEKRFRRLGDVRDHVVDIRLIAATNRDLARRARDGTFRADLYYRINAITLTVPALRQRAEDIPQLARRIANSLGHDIDFTGDAIRAMQAYDWPGNIRELRNVVERAILISNRAARITPNDLRFDGEHLEARAPAAAAQQEPGTLLDAEREHIERVLQFEQGSVERAAVRLGISRSTLYQKLRRFKITRR